MTEADLVLVSKREGRRTVSVDHLFPAIGYRFLTDDKVEEVRQVALSGANVTLSPPPGDGVCSRLAKSRGRTVQQN